VPLHAVDHFENSVLHVPAGYGRNGAGFRCAAMVGASNGSVHMGHRIADLSRGGHVDQLIHGFEKALYVLDGELDLALDGRVYRLGAGYFALVPVAVAHAFRSELGARWVEMLAPQPRDGGVGDDTLFVEPFAWPASVDAPDLGDPRTRFIGRFEDSQLPPPSQLQMDGYSGGNVEGIRLKMLIDRNFGAHQLTLFVVEFAVGGGAKTHSHPFEESYFFLSGEAECRLDGEPLTVRAGDCVWSGVGSTHTFFTRGSVPVRWIETQAPQPPAMHAFRFENDWDAVRTRYSNIPNVNAAT